MIRMWSLVVSILAGAFCLYAGLAALSDLTTAMAVHGTLMIAAWGAILPLGGVVARYFKVTPAQGFPAVVDNPFWWAWHRRLQYSGIALATLGLAVILSETHGRFDTVHGWCGLTVMVIGWLQVISAWCRGSKGGPTDAGAQPDDATTWRGDHFDMTRRRRLFEAWHKPLGWAVFGAAAVTMVLGADLADAPLWLYAILGTLAAGLLVAVIDSHARGRWVDTCVALWGPDYVVPARAGPAAERSGEG